MRMSHSRKMKLAILGVAAGLLMPMAAIAPAHASLTCTNHGSANNVAAATCYGGVQVQLIVTCASVINPFTQSSAWYNLPYGGSVAFPHSVCVGRNPVVHVQTR